MKTQILKPVVAALLAGLVGAAQAQKAEVIHWWTSGGEAAAIKEFADAYTKGGGTWVDTPIAGGGGAQARTVMANRTMGGDPPTAAQYNYGKQYEEIIKAGLLNNLDAVAAKGNWDKLLPEKIRNAVKVDGHYYAVPVNLHNENWVWYNKAVLAKVGAKEPTNLDEMFAAMDKVKAAGITPLALGGQGWQEGITFRGVLLAVGGQDLYFKTFKDKDVSGPGFRKAVETYKKLKAYELQDREGLDTVQANERLGFAADLRDYGVGAQILHDLGVRKMRIITNNPGKRAGIEGYGLSIVERVPLEITPNEKNFQYLRTKKEKLGHVLHLMS